MTRKTSSSIFAGSIIVLGASLGAHSAHAQFGTSSSYVTTNMDASGKAVTFAPGNSTTLSAFQTAISGAYTANTGGDITFDDGVGITIGATVTSLTAKYGASAAKTLTLTGNATDNYDFNNSPATNTTSGSYYFGVNGPAPTDYTLNFSQNLSSFGMMVIDRQSERDLTFTVTLDNGTKITPTNDSNVPTSTDTTGPVFFEYTASGGRTISAIDFTTGAVNSGFVRFDDLGFIVAPASAPEPSLFGGFCLGLLGFALKGIGSRRRIAINN